VGERSVPPRIEVLTPAQLKAAVAAALAHEQAHRAGRAHEWWGRRPTWRKEPSVLMMEGALASGDPMRVLEALEDLARLNGELPG
jgi:hypothetical protein